MAFRPTPPNLVELAIGDVTTAAAILRKTGSGVLGLDCRDLRGGRTAFQMGPQSFDVYAGALDTALGHTRGLKTRGYVISHSGVV